MLWSAFILVLVKILATNYNSCSHIDLKSYINIQWRFNERSHYFNCFNKALTNPAGWEVLWTPKSWTIRDCRQCLPHDIQGLKAWAPRAHRVDPLNKLGAHLTLFCSSDTQHTLFQALPEGKTLVQLWKLLFNSWSVIGQTACLLPSSLIHESVHIKIVTFTGLLMKV